MRQATDTNQNNPSLPISLFSKTPAEMTREEQVSIRPILDAHLKNALRLQLGTAAKPLEEILDNLTINHEEWLNEKQSTVVSRWWLPAARSDSELDEAVAVATASLRPKTSPSVKDILQLDTALEEHPAFKTALRQAKTQGFAQLANLSKTRTKKLLEKDWEIGELRKNRLDELVEENILTERQRKSLEVLIDLSHLTGDNFPLMDAVFSTQKTSIQEWLHYDKAAWLQIIERENITVPRQEKDAERYAENIRDSFEQSFPTAYFTARIRKADYREDTQRVSSIATLSKRNAIIFSKGKVDLDSINWTGTSAAKRKKIEADLPEFTAFVNRYHHLGLEEIVNNQEMDVRTKKSTIHTRLQSLNRFYDNNPGFDFELDNLATTEEKLIWTGIETAERPKIKSQLRAYQRVRALTGNFEQSDRLLKSGLDSAFAIADLSREEFEQKTGFDWKTSTALYKNATERATDSAQALMTIHDAQRGGLRKIRMSNLNISPNDLKDIEGYSDWFGSQDFCECEHCQSIYSPAAYFTDLMHFVEKHISKKAGFTSNLLSNHPLYLKNRRPDLWSLQLTCDNTNTLLPYLQIVNEVLEAYLEKVNSIDDVYKTLAQARHSISAPFNLPLEKVRLYLHHFGWTLHEIYELLRVPKIEQDRERLKISEREMEIITQLYGDSSSNPSEWFGGSAIFGDLEVKAFLPLAGINREELEELLAVQFLDEINKVFIQKAYDLSDIQAWKEKLKGLNRRRLDLIHRFLRLWKKTSWSIPELDLILLRLKVAGILDNLDVIERNVLIPYLSDLTYLQKTLNLKVEELCGLFGDLPQTVLPKSKSSLYARKFNQKQIFGSPSTDSDGMPIYNQDVLVDENTIEQLIPSLLAGLSINEADFSRLLDFFQLDVSATFVLDATVISSLYRHARLARGLKITVAELLKVIEFQLEGQPIGALDDIKNLVDFVAWQKKSPFSVADLILIIRQEANTPFVYKNTLEALTADLLQIHYAQSNENIQLFKEYLAQRFTITLDALTEEWLVHLVPLDLNASVVQTVLAKAFFPGIKDTPPDETPANEQAIADLLPYLQAMERWQLLFEKLKFEPADISFFIAHKEIFGIADLQNLDITGLKNALFYQKTIKLDKELRPETQALLIQYQADGNFSESSIQTIAHLRKQLPTQIQATALVTLGIPALAATSYLWDLADINQKLGTSQPFLQQLLKTGYKDLKPAAESLHGLFVAKYEREEELEAKLAPYNDQLNELKRDALCDFIIAKKEVFKFEDRSDLYKFFLLDPDMSGCFRTSRVVSAISSVQLYLHRVLLNLEQSDAQLNPAIDDVIIKPTWLPTEEWDWRKNYRVWEANRKVFLYPENYIDPTLRDTETHLFEALKNDLLQQKISMPTAEDAYKKYFSDFAQLCKLQYAGAYYHNVSIEEETNVTVKFAQVASNKFQTYKPYKIEQAPNQSIVATESRESQYYLFARTHTDPYQYFYRTYNHYKKVWGNWIPMQIGIEADEVSSLIFRGRLYVFWNEVTRKEMTKLEDGNSTREGVNFTVYLKYAFLDEKGTWSPPQRLKVGTGFVSEELLLNRLSNEDAGLSNNGKISEEVLENFTKEVFNKPYAWLSGQPDTPIHISNIWPVRKNTEVNLVTIPVLFKGKVSPNNPFGRDLRLSGKNVSEVTFEIIGDDVNNKSIEIELIVERKEHFEKEYQVIGSGPGTISLKNINESEISIHLENDLYTHKKVIEHDSVESISNLASSRTTTLSLAKNKLTNVNDSDLFDSSNNQFKEHDFLKKEYTYIINKGETTRRYVENGTLDFTSKNRRILQKKDGTAQLGGTGIWDYFNQTILTTNLTDKLQTTLHSDGLEEFLSLNTQNQRTGGGSEFDMTGSYGTYYWELFFHIPFLIANHLNANQKFKEAKWWYERIFNPVSTEDATKINDKEPHWRFREFRGLNKQKLKELLSDDKAIEAYRADPFDPHAIARLRIAAYQKTIVMKYIDNLLDWGDYLFSQDSREAIHEAEMLYILAADILGKRPVTIGQCETATDGRLTYESIGKRIEKGSEFLLTLENYRYSLKKDKEYFIAPLKAQKAGYPEYQLNSSLNSTVQLSDIYQRINHKRLEQAVFSTRNNNLPLTINQQRPISSYREVRINKEDSKKEWLPLEIDDAGIVGKLELAPVKPTPVYQIVKETLVFCIPENKDLFDYWDRVSDRLFKIRHCMNISGVRRSLALFQPPIDPMFLVRARAAGLSMDDIHRLLAESNQTPHYRFTFLLEKARQYIQTVQSFGSALLSALEKKDAEELILLRSMHERNILSLTTQIKEKQVMEAQKQLTSLQAAKESIKIRFEYIEGLVSEGLIVEEKTQQTFRVIGNDLLYTANLMYLISAGIEPIPKRIGMVIDTGAEGAAKAVKLVGDGFKLFSDINLNTASSVALSGSNVRREQEWNQQLEQVQLELVKIDHDIIASEIREQITSRDLEIHEKQIAHTEDIDRFYRNDKFTGLGLYNYLSTTLTRLYRQSYNMAQQMASTAQQAYRFELGTEEEVFFIEPDNWQSNKTGLLAGEKLLMQLQQMEKSYLEDNVRRMEITQSFSMRQIAPEKLLELKIKGTCNDFMIPEEVFDMFYPGYYYRMIKSVRISIPCVVGPYTNIGCTLSLTANRMRTKPVLNDDAVTTVPLSDRAMIATSSGQNDGGLFELNFRDERYLPFEGVGAISTWNLELPTQIRSFNYNTISDVIFHISYTAKYAGEGAFKESVNNDLQERLSNLMNTTSAQLFSLRHDFPSAWHQFKTEVSENFVAVIKKEHFPYYTQGFDWSGFTVKLWPLKQTEEGVDSSIDIENTSDLANLQLQGEARLEINRSAIDLEIEEWFITIGYELG